MNGEKILDALEIYNELNILLNLLESMKICNELALVGQEHHGEYFSLAHNHVQTYILSKAHEDLQMLLNNIQSTYINLTDEQKEDRKLSL